MAKWLGFFSRGQEKDGSSGQDAGEMDFWDFNRKRTPLVVGEVWKYIGQTTHSSSFMAQAKDWKTGEKFHIVSFNEHEIVLATKDNKVQRTVKKTFFDINFTHRTSIALKESRQQTAGQVMTLLDGDTE